MKGHNRKRPVIERFWDLVDKGDGTGCWSWRGAPTQDTGYGQFGITVNTKTRFVGAHRFSYEITYGPIPGPKGSNPRSSFVMHTCDNRLCVRPDHLRLGTARDNNHDMVAKGRGIGGERHPLARLTAADVLAIRKTYARGRTTQATLAARYDVAPATVSVIIKGQRWRSIGGPIIRRRLQAKLTAEQVEAIRTRFWLRVASARTLAKMYGISDVHVRRIAKRIGWKHVP